MPSKIVNKMYSFEKIAIIITVIITVIILVLVGCGTMGKGRPSSPNPSSLLGGTTDISGESGDADLYLSTAPAEKEIQFTTIKVENTQLKEGDLILVNQEHQYTVNIEDKLYNLYSHNQKLTESGENWYGLVNVKQSLRKEAWEALNLMYKAYYTAIDKADVTITKSYVDADSQQTEYDAKVDTADAGAKPYLQAGGYSEHQTGLAFNLRNDDNQWFIDNCWKYGFIFRYPEGKESITYVRDENNHYRYVGVPHAAYMKTNKLVLEEYLGLLETKTYTSRLKLDDGASVYETYTVKATAGDETDVKVPAESSGWNYMVSGTNDEYFVITIYKAAN